VSDDLDASMNFKDGRLRVGLSSRATGTALLVTAYGAAIAAVLSVVGVLFALVLGYDIDCNLKDWSFKFKRPVHMEYEADRHKELDLPRTEKPPEIIPDKRQGQPTGSVPIAGYALKPRSGLRYYNYASPDLDAYLGRILKAPCVPGFDFPEVCYMNGADRSKIVLRPRD
jgi:hypothetical protein